MNKQKLIEKLAIKMSADYNLDYDTELRGPSWDGEATTAVEMFWPLIEAAVKVHSYEHLDEDSSVFLLEAASRSMGGLDRAVTALTNFDRGKS